MDPLLGMTTVDTAPRGDLFIGGCRVDTSNRLPVVDPATGKELASVSVAGAAECEAAVAAADASLEGWARSSPRDRAEVLRRAFEIMTAQGEQIARIITLENGISPCALPRLDRDTAPTFHTQRTGPLARRATRGTSLG